MKQSGQTVSPRTQSLGVWGILLCGLLVLASGGALSGQVLPAQSEAEHPLLELPQAQGPVVVPVEAPPAAPKPAESKPAEQISQPAVTAPKATEAATVDPQAVPKVSVAELPPAKKASAGETKPDENEKPYLIGSLDVLYIRVWNNQNLTGPVDVRPDGMISLPLIGEIKADGLTVAALKEAIKTRLEDFLNSPEVDVQVSRVNSKKYFILGGVNRPGAFPLVGRTTVSEALSGAAGFRDFANQKKIYVLRGTKKFNFNYKDVILGKHLEQDIPLENGDKIVVPE